MNTPTLINEQITWREHPIDVLGLSTRSYNALRRFGVETLGQLYDLVVTDLITEVKNVGHQSHSEICNKLDAYLATIPELATVEPSANDLPALPTSALEGPEPSKTPEPVVSKPLPEQPSGIPQDRITIWLSVLDERERQVLAWRYGLQGEPLTLEAIGENLGVTRERVRQIESRAIARLCRPARKSILAPLLTAISSAFERMGGLLTDGEAADVGGQLIPAGTMRELGVMRLLGKTSRKFGRHNRTGVWIWGDKKDLVQNAQTKMTHILKAAMAPIGEDDLLRRLRESSFYRRNKSDLPESFLRACLRTHPALEHHENGLVGLEQWAKHRADDIVLALRRIGRPAHYTEIAEIVNESLSPGMRTGAHNVHALLQRMPDVFVWVGRGTYGLAEWGLERSEYYADIVERILREYGHPLSIQEVLTRVCEVRDCKESTVLMLLTLNDRFRAFPGGVYGLAEWRDDEFPDSSYREKRLMVAVGDAHHQRKSKPEVAQVLRDIDDLISMVSTEVGTG